MGPALLRGAFRFVWRFAGASQTGEFPSETQEQGRAAQKAGVEKNDVSCR